MRYILKISLILFLCVPLWASAFTVPAQPTGFVQDYASVLTAEQVASLEQKLEQYERQSTSEIAVVTIPSLDGDTVENVAQEIFTQWGIGKKDTNNGVLFLISIGDRKTRIHTGYGVEGDLTDLGTSYIQRDIVTPAFRGGDYYGGINGAVDAMVESLGGANIVPEDYSVNEKGSGINFELILFFGFVILQFLGAILGRSKSWWAGGLVGGVVGGLLWALNIFALSVIIYFVIVVVLTLLGLLFDFIVSKAYGIKDKTGAFPIWFMGGGRGGRGGGGGFGGFGGGGSGGGGSSGSW